MSIVEIYECDDCHVRSEETVYDGLPDDWGYNVDGDHRCVACNTARPFDPHECEGEFCCYVMGDSPIESATSRS